MSFTLGIFLELIKLSPSYNPQQPKPKLKPQEMPFANTHRFEGFGFCLSETQIEGASGPFSQENLMT